MSVSERTATTSSNILSPFQKKIPIREASLHFTGSKPKLLNRYLYFCEKTNDSPFNFDEHFHELSEYTNFAEIVPKIDLKKSRLIKFLLAGYSLSKSFIISRKEKECTILLTCLNNSLDLYHLNSLESLHLYSNKKLEKILRKFRGNIDPNFLKDLVYNSYYENLLVCVNLRPELRGVNDDILWKENSKF